MTNFTPFPRNLALVPSTVLPLCSAVLQTPKSVTKPVSPESLGTDVYNKNDLDLRNKETGTLPLESGTLDVLKEQQQLLPLLENRGRVSIARDPIPGWSWEALGPGTGHLSA